MDVKELLDDDALDPKRLFDQKEYVTLLVNRDGFNKKENDTADLVYLLLEKELTREEQEDIYSKLKAKNASDMLVEAIKNVDRKSDKAKLIAACWESGLDFSSHFLFFTELACDADFLVSMEALTVVDNIDAKLDENILSAALEIAQNSKSKNTHNIEDLIANIKHRIS